MRKVFGICLLAFLVGCGGSDKKEEKKEGDKKASLPTTSVPMTNASWVPVQEEAKQEEAEQEEATEEKDEDTVDSVIEEFDDSMAEFRKAYEEAEEEDKRSVFQELYPKANEYARRLMKLVEDEPESEEAVKAFTWVVSRARGAMGTKAAELLSEHHMESEAMATIALTKTRARPSEKEFEFLQNLIDNSPHERVKGIASYAKAMQLKSASRTFNSLKTAVAKAEEDAVESKDKDGEVEKEAALALKKATRNYNGFGKSIGDDALKMLTNDVTGSGETVESMFESVNETYGDVVLYEQADPPATVGAQCAGILFEIQNLTIGKVAPDIEASDLDGESFKLSDYRGKVVVIDFWGDW